MGRYGGWDSSGLCWRPVVRGDVPALAALIREVERVDRTGHHVDEAELAAEFAGTALDPARDTLAAALPDGGLAGYATVHLPLPGGAAQRVFLAGAVHPAWRGRGLGRRLLAWQVDRAAQVHREVCPALPVLVTAGGVDRDDPQRRLMRRAGFAPVRWWYGMERDLADPPPACPPPAGLLLRGYDPGRGEEVRRAHNEAFAGHWGSGEVGAEVWRGRLSPEQGFRADLSLLALDPSGTVAAYLLSFVHPAEITATGRLRVHVGYVGTRPAWRGRGAASALLSAALSAYRARGYTSARLVVDTANPTGALGVYRRAGFAVADRWVTYGRRLPPIVE
jgi:mycothiol synthase